jgi:hypothetical protein
MEASDRAQVRDRHVNDTRSHLYFTNCVAEDALIVIAQVLLLGLTVTTWICQ